MVGDFFLSYSSCSLKYHYIVGGIILYYDFDFVKNCILEGGILSYFNVSMKYCNIGSSIISYYDVFVVVSYCVVIYNTLILYHF